MQVSRRGFFKGAALSGAAVAAAAVGVTTPGMAFANEEAGKEGNGFALSGTKGIYHDVGTSN